MIVYAPNRNWLKDILHLTRSWTIQRVVRWTIAMGGYTAVLAFVFTEIFPEPVAQIGIFSLLGIILSILMVFRTNSAYDRWWEGRKQWGALVNNSRNLAIHLEAILPEDDTQNRVFFAKNISNFCLALKEHLRSGTKTEELIHLGEDEKTTIAQADHPPLYISMRIRKRVEHLYSAGLIADAQHISLAPLLQSLADILGACERIKKTPIPFSYNVYIKIFITAYLLMLPFALISTLGYYTIPVVMFLSFAMIGVELIGEEIEDPFGLDCNDLPTGDIALTIKRNVYAIFSLPEQPEIEEKRELYEKVF